MNRNKTAHSPRGDRAWVTAAEWFAGGRRVWYDPESARVLTEDQAAALCGVQLARTCGSRFRLISSSAGTGPGGEHRPPRCGCRLHAWLWSGGSSDARHRR